MTSKNKPFRPNPLLLVLIAAGFLGACSRDDFPEKIIEPTIVAPAPSTMSYMPAEAVGQQKMAGAEDLTTIATDDPVVKKILVALQAKDDKALKAIEESQEDMDSVFCPPLVCAGAQFEPAEEVQKIMDKMNDLARNNPEVYVKLGEYSQRKDASDNIVPFAWYERAIQLGSQAAEEKFAALAEAEKGDTYGYLKLAEIFGGTFPDSPSMDAKKAAGYLSKAFAKGVNGDIRREQAKSVAAVLVKRDGPDVAAPLWPLLLEQYPNPHPATAEAKAEALKTCVELGGNPDNPLSGKDASFDKSAGKIEASACRIVVETDENNRQAMANLGYALERTGDKDGALIAYARAAEMGDSWAIAQYWHARYGEDPKKMRAALEAEAAAGNPWANMAISNISAGVWNPRDKDSKLREEQLVVAASKNIPAAQNHLGMIYEERKNYDEAIKMYKQAAYNGSADAMFNIGMSYEEGIGVSKDIDTAKKWYGRAQANGHAEAAKQLAKLELGGNTKSDEKGKAVQAASVTGGWFCDATQEEGKDKVGFLFSDRLFNYRIGNLMSLTSYDYKASGARGSGTFQEITGKGGDNSNAAVPYELSFISASPEKLVFDLKITGQKGVTTSKNECVPLEANPAPKSKPSQASPSQESGGDRVAAYANNLASQMERSSHPACQMLANNIRTFGNSGAPEVARERQVEAILNKAPSFCF